MAEAQKKIEVDVPLKLQHLNDPAKAIKLLLEFAVRKLEIDENTTDENITQLTANEDASNHYHLLPKRLRPADITDNKNSQSFPSFSATPSNVSAQAIVAFGNSMAAATDREAKNVPTLSSSRLGQVGEETVQSMLQEITFISIVNTSKQSHCGDFLIQIDSKEEVLVEVKNYKNQVPSSEVDKFRSDLEQQKKQYGLFISPSARISGKRVVDLEERNNTTILFLSSFAENSDCKALVHIAVYWMRSYIKLKKQNAKVSSEIENDYAVALCDFLKECEAAQKRINDFRELIKSHLSHTEEFVRIANLKVSEMELVFQELYAKVSGKSSDECTTELSALHKHFTITENASDHVLVKDVQTAVTEELHRHVSQRILIELCVSQKCKRFNVGKQAAIRFLKRK